MSHSMRSQEEMMDLIVETAKQDVRIRAAILNGSRVNPNAAPDLFQDYDVVYVVEDLAPFLADPGWIDRFGERMIVQMPDAMADPPPLSYDQFAYLMQFLDGNRIDLTLFPNHRLNEFRPDSLSRLLLDKDGILDPLPEPHEGDYLPEAPSEKAFSDCCNEFWWVCPYVAKGLWREELLYAKATLEIVRNQLVKMLTWHVGVQTQFGANLGAFSKRLDIYLEPNWWDMLEATYADAGFENTWDALFTMGTLFRTTAVHVADHFGYAYPHGDDARVSAHLRHVRALAKDATKMY